MALLGMPTNPVGIYWESYYGAMPRITQLSQAYNIIFLFHALPVEHPSASVSGAVEFDYTAPNYLRGATTATLNADIAECRNRGQRVILTCGGANGQVAITASTRDAFIASIKSINESLGTGTGNIANIDGIDFNNFEGAEAGTATPASMAYVAQQLKDYYGTNFLITAPPAPMYGAPPVSAQVTSDRLLLATMYGTVDSQGNPCLDWMCPQTYDNADSEPEIAWTRDAYRTAITVPNIGSVQIPGSVIGIGFRVFPGGVSPDGLTQWATNAECATAYTNAVTAYPDPHEPRGGFVFSVNNNATNGSGFAATVAPVMNNYTDPPVDTPAFSLVASSNFTNGAATTAQLTAPAGKTSGADFQAGTINESSNPAAALNLASGKYTEIEWCIKANAAAINGQQYEFRVTYNGTALDTYSVTPTWTIGTAPGSPPGTTRQVTGTLTATGLLTLQL